MVKSTEFEHHAFRKYVVEIVAENDFIITYVTTQICASPNVFSEATLAALAPICSQSFQR
jgi:hypothetical protein